MVYISIIAFFVHFVHFNLKNLLILKCWNNIILKYYHYIFHDVRGNKSSLIRLKSLKCNCCRILENVHCVKNRNFTLFPGVNILCKCTVSVEFWVNRLKFCGNFALSGNFYSRNLGKISAFYVVVEITKNIGLNWINAVKCAG